MSHIILERWQPTEDFSRHIIREAVTETRSGDKQEAYARFRAAWRQANQQHDYRGQPCE